MSSRRAGQSPTYRSSAGRAGCAIPDSPEPTDTPPDTSCTSTSGEESEMPLNASEIRVAGTGRVLIAPPNTPAPANFTTDWAAPWVDLGYTSTDGAKFTKKDKLDPIDTWQTVAAIRYVYSDRDLSVKSV